MKVRRTTRAAGALIGTALGAGLLATAALPGGMAGAASKQVQVGNGTAVSVPKGWVAGKASGGKLQITHKSPQCVIEIVTGTNVSASPPEPGERHLHQFCPGVWSQEGEEDGRPVGADSR
ncbi:MAG TPA: hypothetical protein VGF87_05360 [Acidimicrobiales bacterium]|jgi:hypothetical protein